MTRRRGLGVLLAAVAVLTCTGPGAADEVELYRARSRPANELAALIAPLLAPEGTAVSDDSGGFVLLRGPAEAVAQALETLATLDVAPRQYRIHSELVSHAVLQARGVRVGGWIQLGDLRVGRTLDGPERIELSAGQLRADSGRQFQASVVALENTPAEIWTGNLFPFSVSSFEVERFGRRARVHETTAWVPVRQGLRVRARRAGEAVELDLVPVIEDGHPARGIRELGAATRVRVAPGESLVIGSLARDDQLRTADPLASAVDAQLGGDVLLVRVDELD